MNFLYRLIFNADGRPLSMAQRLLLASILTLPLFFTFTALALDRAFQQSLTSAERQSLAGTIYLLLAAAELEPQGGSNTLKMPDTLLEPRLNEPYSGLYAYVIDASGEVLWQSPSATLEYHQQLPPLGAQPSAEFAPGQHFVDEPRAFRLYRDVLWDSDSNPIPLRFVVRHHKHQYFAELYAYRDQLWLWLAVSGFALLIIQVIALRGWALAPMRRLVGKLKNLEAGDSRQIEGDYPSEIRPLIDNLNQLLAREAEQRQRYRDALGNLAHSLKTPLAALQQQIEQLEQGRQAPLTEQIERMNQVITHQLQRAVSRHSNRREQVSIHTTCTRICAALGKVYAARELNFNLQVDETLQFHGDAADLMEVLGNLIENACKHARRQIEITARRSDQQLIIEIGDDGPGIASSERERVLQRGQRADSLHPGQGIGLSVAAQIVADYGGQLSIDESSLGGALIRIEIAD